MLASHPVDPMIPGTDLGVAREFYRGVEIEQYDEPG